MTINLNEPLVFIGAMGAFLYFISREDNTIAMIALAVAVYMFVKG